MDIKDIKEYESINKYESIKELINVITRFIDLITKIRDHLKNKSNQDYYIRVIVLLIDFILMPHNNFIKNLSIDFNLTSDDMNLIIKRREHFGKNNKNEIVLFMQKLEQFIDEINNIKDKFVEFQNEKDIQNQHGKINNIIKEINIEKIRIQFSPLIIITQILPRYELLISKIYGDISIKIDIDTPNSNIKKSLIQCYEKMKGINSYINESINIPQSKPKPEPQSKPNFIFRNLSRSRSRSPSPPSRSPSPPSLNISPSP